MDIYLSTEFQEKENNPDKDEFLYILKVPLSDCIKMIENGKIKDAKTVIGIMCAKEIILGKDKNLYP